MVLDRHDMGQRGAERDRAYMGRKLENSIVFIPIIEIHAHVARSVDLLGLRVHCLSRPDQGDIWNRWRASLI
jgi:hypothetical protein